MQPPSGFHHVTLTVSDLSVSVPWYERVLGAAKAADREGAGFRRAILRTPGGLVLGLTRHDATRPGDRFDERRIGLDHVSFACAGRAEVEAWGRRLDELGIANSGITDAPYGHVLVFRDPDAVQLEFFAPVSP